MFNNNSNILNCKQQDQATNFIPICKIIKGGSSGRSSAETSSPSVVGTFLMHGCISNAATYLPTTESEVAFRRNEEERQRMRQEMEPPARTSSLSSAPSAMRCVNGASDWNVSRNNGFSSGYEKPFH